MKHHISSKLLSELKKNFPNLRDKLIKKTNENKMLQQEWS